MLRCPSFSFSRRFLFPSFLLTTSNEFGTVEINDHQAIDNVTGLDRMLLNLAVNAIRSVSLSDYSNVTSAFTKGVLEASEILENSRDQDEIDQNALKANRLWMSLRKTPTTQALDEISG